MTDDSQYSGLFVNADGIMHEGEPARWLTSHDTTAASTTATTATTTAATTATVCDDKSCKPEITSQYALTMTEEQVKTAVEK